MLLHQFRQDYDLPVLILVVDGTRDSVKDIRLEAFWDQCNEHMRYHRSGI